MNASSRDGFVTMVSAFVATAFYGVPLVVAALGSGPSIPEVTGAPAAVEAPTVRMLLPVQAPEPEPEPVEIEEAPEPEVVPPRPEAPAPPAASPGEGGAAEAPIVAEVGEAPRGGADGKGEAPEDRAARRKARRQKVCDVPHPNIRSGEGRVDINRSLVEQYTKNLQTFMSLGHSHPYDKGGVRGWYIGGFSCTSPVHKAGFRRGDILLSVNGKNTRSWIGVYLLYQKLKHKDDFDIQVVRKGEPITLKFRIVPD